MLAAIQGTTAIGQWLIVNGASVNAVNDFDESALSLAACGGHLRFIELLKQHGADASHLRPRGQDLETWLQSASGFTPEMIAILLKAAEN